MQHVLAVAEEIPCDWRLVERVADGVATSPITRYAVKAACAALGIRLGSLATNGRKKP